MKGYKVFNQDWTCRDFQYEVGETYEMSEKPVCWNKGFYYCKDLKDCFSYYNFDPNNKVAIVEAFGDIDSEDNSKYCTNKIKIIEELSWEEVLRLVNTGKANSGFCNSGNWNSGNRNSGDRNSGFCNSGNWNSGNWNSGNGNSGNRNTGNWNSGDNNSGNYNSGNWNSGNNNSGDWNKTKLSGGCFNTKTPRIFMFDKLSDITLKDWLNMKARYILNDMPTDGLFWIWSDDMSSEEKEKHPEHETTGGFLRKIELEEGERQKWWNNLSEEDKNEVLSIPNFDPRIFEEITGIKVD